MRALLVILFLTLTLPRPLLAQISKSASNVRTLEWEQPRTIPTSHNTGIKTLHFKGAYHDLNESRLPFYSERIKAPAGAASASASLVQPVYEALTPAEQSLLGNSEIPSEIIISALIGKEKKQPYLSIQMIPLRKNASGQVEKLVSFGLSISWQEGSKSQSQVAAQSYAASSMLAQGSWYRIGVTKDGIYKITPDFLNDMGIDLASVNPQTIGIYGYGGGMLPHRNNVPHHDDVVENAIYVAGESDNVFNENDYILFYGEGPHRWSYSDTDGRFHYEMHDYSDTTYYFIHIGSTPGKRISSQASSTASNINVTTFDDYAAHEKDLYNLIKTGREWYGESFEVQSSYNIPFTFPNIDVSTPGYVRVNLVSRLASQHHYNVSCGSGSLLIHFNAVNPNDYNGIYAHAPTSSTPSFPNPTSFTFTPPGANISVNISKAANASGAQGWLDFVEVNVRRQLSMNGDQMFFRDRQSVAPGNISRFVLSNASPTVSIWEVTDPVNVRQQSASVSGSGLEFIIATDSLREFIAFTGSSFLTPVPFGRVGNQNLHALGTVDMIIVSHPLFLQQANRLAEHHSEKDSLDVIVVTPQQIYNEFSSGIQDIAAIRNFVKMFYDRAGSNTALMPRYLLLFGDGSYDNKHRKNPNSNFIPTWESASSLAPTASYVSDDFYGLLDDTEGLMGQNEYADIGIGRFPVRNTTEAKTAVDKVIRYTAESTVPLETSSSACTDPSTASAFGDWRNMLLFVADDEDGNQYHSDANNLANYIATNYKNYNIDKVFIDAYQQYSTPGGERYPDATEALVKRVERGSLIVNYVGHGGEVGWAEERILELSHIKGWKNYNKLALFLTATCEFSRYDDPERTSAGEYALLNPEGGAIALLTTTRLVYNSENIQLCSAFYQNVFEELSNGKMPTLGDLYSIIKNMTSGTTNNARKFALLGDPALKLAYPKHTIVTDSINSIAVTPSSSDTMQALSIVKVSGHVRDKNGNILTNYNGILYPTVYEKASTITSLSNNGPGVSPPVTFQLRKNIIYKGKASVINGRFSFTFVVPKDINYQFGTGRISYYVQDGKTDGAGYYENIVVGGVGSLAGNDNTGPEIDLYMNDSTFVPGGITDEKPQLFAKIKDPSGVNTVGTGIGHDIMAVLDENTEDAIVLNDYYEADLNSYKSGSVRYPFSELNEGNHRLSIKVWDVYNNSSVAYTDFVVAKSARLALSHVLNYPNPFTTKTQFFFEHNKCCDLMDVQIQIFTVSGKLVKTIQTLVNSEGFRSEPIEWDGRDDFGDKIGRGVYIYRIKVRNSFGDMADAYEKLVILN
jgi:hypothetical protein